jgi:hypothetical protein
MYGDKRDKLWSAEEKTKRPKATKTGKSHIALELYVEYRTVGYKVMSPESTRNIFKISAHSCFTDHRLQQCQKLHTPIRLTADPNTAVPKAPHSNLPKLYKLCHEM